MQLSNSYRAFVSVFSIKTPKGASSFILKILNKCILSILVYNLFLVGMLPVTEIVTC